MSHLLHSNTWNEETLFSDFHRDGFVCVDSVLSTDLVHCALLGVHNVLNGHYDTGKAPLFSQNVGNQVETNRVGQIHWANSAISDLVKNPAIGQIISVISGSSRIKLWGSQLYFKPARQRPLCQIGFHRDSQHLPCFKKGCYTIWIPLVDVSSDNGAIIYIKGSHDHRDENIGLGADVPNVTTLIESKYSSNYEAIQAKVGDICIHHQDIVHGSMNNSSSSYRAALALSVVSDDCLFDKEEDYYNIRDILNDSSLVYVYGDDDV